MMLSVLTLLLGLLASAASGKDPLNSFYDAILLRSYSTKTIQLLSTQLYLTLGVQMTC